MLSPSSRLPSCKRGCSGTLVVVHKEAEADVSAVYKNRGPSIRFPSTSTLHPSTRMAGVEETEL